MKCHFFLCLFFLYHNTLELNGKIDLFLGQHKSSTTHLLDKDIQKNILHVIEQEM